MRFMKEHPWRIGAVALVVLLVGLTVVLFVGREHETARSSAADPHAGLDKPGCNGGNPSRGFLRGPAVCNCYSEIRSTLSLCQL